MINSNLYLKLKKGKDLKKKKTYKQKFYTHLLFNE